MRKPIPKSRTRLKKLRWPDPEGKRASLPKWQASKGSGFRRGALRAYKLAPKTLLSTGVSAAVDRETLLRVDLSVCLMGAAGLLHRVCRPHCALCRIVDGDGVVGAR